MTDLSGNSTPPAIVFDPTVKINYRRTEQLQESFEAAAASLLLSDGWENPDNGGARELVADLALEGGGVKGIALVGAALVLHEAGYRFRAVAGTSAGAIAASLISALSRPGKDITDLKAIMDTMVFAKFMPEGKIHAFADKISKKIGGAITDAVILKERTGLYPGTYLYEWLGPQLEALGVVKFSDLKIDPSGDSGMSFPAGQAYSLVVHTSDVTRQQLVRLPWDYQFYGHQADDEHVVDAVRASMSIPFFFEPFELQSLPCDVPVPKPDGTTENQHFAGGSVTWVDGGMLRNFPIDAFDRADGGPPRWPTIGMKLSSFQTSFGPDEASETSLSLGIHALHTMMNEWDMYGVEEDTAGRTIFIDNDGLTATEFDLTKPQQDSLFINGVTAATNFIIEMAAFGRVPRSGPESKAFIQQKRDT